MNPRTTRALAVLGLLLFLPAMFPAQAMAGDDPAAVASIRNYDSHLQAGMEFWKNGEPAQALPELRAAALLAEARTINAPEAGYRMFATSLNILGVCEQALGDYEACVVTTDRILRHTNQMDASEEAEWRMNRATCLSSLDRGSEALLEYDLALALLEQDEGHSESTQARLHLLRGSGRFNTGDVLGAARDSYTALKIYGDSKFENWSPQDIYNIGVIHFNLGLIHDDLSASDLAYQSYHIGLVIMTLADWPDDGTLAKCRAKYIHHAEMNGDDEKRRMVEAGQCRPLGHDLMEWVEMALSHSSVLGAFSEG